MPYIGNTPAEKYAAFDVQYFTTSATTSYTLDNAVANELDIRLVINNVIQEPGSGKAYTASGTTLTLSSATAGTDTMYAVYTGKASQTVNPPAGSVDLTSTVTGTLPIANGGTGSTATTFVNATANITGVVPAANLGTGTASSSTVLYGDGTFKAEPGGGSLVYLGGINASNHNANTLRLEQVFANDYRRYKVMGKFQGTDNNADIRFRWLKSDNNEEQSNYHTITGGNKSNSVSISSEEWLDWGQQYSRMFTETATGSHIFSFSMDLFPNQNENVNYPTAIFQTQAWGYNGGANRQRFINGVIYNEITTSIAGGGMQLQSTSGLFGTVNMSIWGYKDS